MKSEMPMHEGPCGPGAPARAKVDQILAAARRVFLEHGFGAATTDMIQREAGVSKSTVYAHFPTKTDLFQAVIGGECGRFMDGVLMAAEGRTDTADVLTEIGTAFLDLLLSPPALAFHRIIVAEAARFPSLGHAFYEAGPARLHARVAGVLQQAQDRAEIAVTEPAVAVEHFFGMLRGDMHLRCLLGLEQKPDHAEVRAAVNEIVLRFLKAYASPQSARPAAPALPQGQMP